MEEAATGGLQLETLAHEFSCEFCEISKNTLFTEHLQTTSSQENFAQKWKNQPQEACNFIKKETLAHVFSCEFCEHGDLLLKSMISSNSENTDKEKFEYGHFLEKKWLILWLYKINLLKALHVDHGVDNLTSNLS